MNSKFNHFTVAFFCIMALLVAYQFVSEESIAEEKTESQFPGENGNYFEPTYHFYYRGILADSLKLITGEVRRNENLSHILSPYEVPENKLVGIRNKYKALFDVRNMRASKPYAILATKGTNPRAVYFFYDISQEHYFQVNLDQQNGGQAEVCYKETYFKKRTVGGTITSSLYNSMVEKNLSPELVNELADIFGWQVDFFRLQKGDSYKVIFDEKWIDDKAIGMGQVRAAVFNQGGRDFYALHFDQGNGINYYDQNGESLQKAFLRAPLKFSRISSHFTYRRYHPVQKRYKPHLGTDYAAPTGTLIRTVGDGKVVEARYSKYNGNYVKIRHNRTYTTQYLHMSKIAAGMRPGKVVKKGELIGFVGSTGLATGPHLCFRFWKNGVQINPLKIDIPAKEPIALENKSEYMTLFMEMKKELDKIKVNRQSLLATTN